MPVKRLADPLRRHPAKMSGPTGHRLMANSLVVRKGTDLAKRIRALRAAQYVRMPKVIPYALRHSSIVRGLRKGLPIQQVAKLHNTSVKMIERHYAK